MKYDKQQFSNARPEQWDDLNIYHAGLQDCEVELARKAQKLLEVLDDRGAWQEAKDVRNAVANMSNTITNIELTHPEIFAPASPHTLYDGFIGATEDSCPVCGSRFQAHPDSGRLICVYEGCILGRMNEALVSIPYDDCRFCGGPTKTGYLSDDPEQIVHQYCTSPRTEECKEEVYGKCIITKSRSSR